MGGYAHSYCLGNAITESDINSVSEVMAQTQTQASLSSGVEPLPATTVDTALQLQHQSDQRLKILDFLPALVTDQQQASAVPRKKKREGGGVL